MIVERWTWKVKIGCKDEVVKLVKALVEEVGLTPRVCTYKYGPHNIVTSDLEFETEEGLRQFWKESGQQIANNEWHKKYTSLVESYKAELLQVH